MELRLRRVGVTVYGDYSINGGSTWINISSHTLTGGGLWLRMSHAETGSADASVCGYIDNINRHTGCSVI